MALAMCAAVFSGCGKFDIDGEDLSAYVTLGDITAFPYDEILENYEEYRDSLGETTKSFYPSSGCTLDFEVVSVIVADDLSTTKIDKWTCEGDHLVKGYDLHRYAENSVFDTAVSTKVDDASKTSTTSRLVKIGEAFSFTMRLNENYEDATLAGKLLKFTITVKKVLPPVYTDSYIADDLMAFYAAVARSKDIIEEDDTVKLNYTGTIDGEKFDGSTGENFIITIGAGELPFENLLVGHKNSEKFELTYTYPEDYEDEKIAGKEAVFAIVIKDVYNDDKLISDNTPFDNMWDLKDALRVKNYAEQSLMDIVYERSTMISCPEKLLSAFRKIFKKYVNQSIAEQIQAYEQIGEHYTKKEMREKLYPDGSDKTYIEESAKNAAYRYITVKLTQQALELEYTEKQYQIDLERMASEYTSYYGTTYTTRDMENLFGEEMLRLSFLETAVLKVLSERITGAPEIPMSSKTES